MNPAAGDLPWVLLRGLTREAGHWGPLPALLAERLPGVRILTIDLPGAGERHAVRSPTSIRATMEDCRAQLHARGVTRCHLLAMSLGAMVAVEWAHRHPQEVASAVLVNTSLRPFSAWHQRLRPRHYPALLGVLWPWRDAQAREAIVLRLTSRRRFTAAQKMAVVDAWVALRERHPVSIANALRQLLAAARYRAPAQAPGVPLQVLVGGGDVLVDPGCSRRLAQAWRLPIAEHPTAGHDLALDDPDWVAAQVETWGGLKPAETPSASR
ncbi:alpha/beta fold hydrolase [Variovorax sp. N23]|uniref:alpha/beta fold hydrolase n=1 Tax=Variovorax sp. N23 TaxID=2980555 RepID=UPI0021C76041|nr:alpha/beta hydrolase [Variovorax sp. N23]MCU4122230.1 alpha/beta hydrolase [Variovorax sp. N23]